MRLELKFLLKNAEIETDYRASIMSFFKYALEKKYSLLYKELYDSNNVKPFSFSVFLPDAKIDGHRYILSGNIFSVKFSSSDTALLFSFYNAMTNAVSLGYDYELPFENSLRLIKVSYSNTQKIASQKVLIKFLSPLLVRAHEKEGNKDRYLDYTSEDFGERLQDVVGFYLKTRGIKNGKITLKPIEAKRTVAVCMKLKFNCSYGEFELTARPDIIEELYLAGVGSRRSEGFGLFDIKCQIDDESADIEFTEGADV
ncbi:MAG: CRISPR-associated endoribonuclease Cas6 [Clostridiales bacterium]|jgi:CRISPR-associated endoribonuclease Cas6|nr:CRISPR-associated endoribonuclease Cas6 [Clostridiales bacterium]